MHQFPHTAVQDTETLIQCQTCTGKGYFAVDGFDGRERVTCDNCGGFGGWEWIEPVDDLETATTVEEYWGAAPAAPIAVDHPGMSATFFDDAIRRAHDAGLGIQFIGDETALVSSASNPTICYRVDRHTCSCQGHQGHSRCLHRAFYLFMTDVAPITVAVPIAA